MAKRRMTLLELDKALAELGRVRLHKRGCAFSHPMDEMRRLVNQRFKRPLCQRCNGTGNELFSMFRRCARCGGTGVRKGFKHA